MDPNSNRSRPQRMIRLWDGYYYIITRGVNTGGRVGRVNSPAFENFVFFAQKNCAFESILVTNPYERTCCAPSASRSRDIGCRRPPPLP